MGRKLRTKVPILPSSPLSPQSPDLAAPKQKEYQAKEKQRENYNKLHAAKERPPLNPGDSVFIKDLQRQGQISKLHSNPRSYITQTD